MNTKPIGILCVDDNLPLAESLRCIIEQEPDMCWLGHEAQSGGLLETVRRLAPDIVLLDLAMPGSNPMESMAQLAESDLPTRVIVLSGYATPGHVQRALDAGAWGYVAKEEGVEAMLESIRRVAAGDVAFGRHFSAATPGAP